MVLSYKNLNKNEIFSNMRNVNYANSNMVFGFNNTAELDFTLTLSVEHISMQADVFARAMLTHRSLFDMKRFLGQYTEDWLRLLHEVYIYDRLKCIYYGLKNPNMINIPNDSYSFPGNVLLLNLIAKQSFRYNTDDSQPYSLYHNVICSSDINALFESVFEAYPNLRFGFSGIENVNSYVNTTYESILIGLKNAKMFLSSKNQKGSLCPYDIVLMNNETIRAFCSSDQNPLGNGFLNSDLNKFFFILPERNSGPEAMRFNESIFISRALGFVSNQIYTEGNPHYKVASRNSLGDPFTREEVYAVTSLKSEIMPYSRDEMGVYLKINSYTSINITRENMNVDNRGGSTSSTNFR